MIYINGRFLLQRLTGVQRFAYELSVRICQLKDNVVILVPKIASIRKDYLVETLPIQEVRGGSGYFWEQVTLPFFFKKNNGYLLLNLCNTGPAFIKRQIVSLHDITYIRYPSSFSFLFRKFYGFLIPLLINNSRFIITVSEFSKKEISGFYSLNSDKIYVIPNAVDMKFCAKQVEKICSDEYFLTVSSVCYHKNLHGLVNAILSSDIDVKLKIIGDKNSVFNFIDVDVDDPRIVFLGRVTDEQLVTLYQYAKAFVFPSYYEGFGIPPLEAQACQCPVISSNRAAMPEILNSSALFFDPCSDENIIDTISIINDNPEIRRDLIQKGLNNIGRFSWDKSAENIIELIDKFEGA